MSIGEAFNKWKQTQETIIGYSTFRQDTINYKPVAFSLVGSKSHISDVIADAIGPLTGDLIDPFFGSGGAILRMCQLGKVGGKIIAYEASPLVVDVWKTIKHHGHEIVPMVKKIYQEQGKNGVIDREIAGRLSDKFNSGIDNPVERAATFIILSDHAFNGNLQLNSSGKITGGFMNPRTYGGKIRYTGALTQGRIRRLENAIKAVADCNINVELAAKDTWMEKIRSAKPCDAIYLDPPYPERKFKYPGERAVGNWTDDDTKNLIREATKAVKHGVKVVISNSPGTAALIGKENFSIITFCNKIGCDNEPNELIAIGDSKYKELCNA